MDRADVVIHFPGLARSIGPALLQIVIEDVSESDAPSQVLARLELHIPQLDLSQPSELRAEVPYFGTGGDLAVSAHLSPNAARRAAPGDLVTPAMVRVVAGEVAEVHLAEYRP